MFSVRSQKSPHFLHAAVHIRIREQLDTVLKMLEQRFVVACLLTGKKISERFQLPVYRHFLRGNGSQGICVTWPFAFI